MPQITLARELHHEQIEFPKSIPCPENRRGGRGSSLHLQRGKARDVTDEELAWIKAHRPEVFRHLDVAPTPRVGGRTVRRLQRAQERAAQSRKAAEAAEAARVEEAASAAKPKPKRSTRNAGK